MAWYSILPPNLVFLECWTARVFVFLGLLTLIPWTALLAFDIAFYILRMIAYEVPIIGGRARGAQRPRAPSLSERTGGRGRNVFGGVGVLHNMEGEKIADGFEYGDGEGLGEVLYQGEDAAVVGKGMDCQMNKENVKGE